MAEAADREREGLPTAEPDVLEEVRRGLSAPRKELPPKFFYDERGSELFEEITRLPEYYPTRTERGLLEAAVPAWLAEFRPCSLVELGAGSAAKTRVILDAMEAADHAELYVPVDISADFLASTAEALAEEYPRLHTRPLVADISGPLEFPSDLPAPVLFAFLGSTIGNFEPEAAVDLLRSVRAGMKPPDRFLLGVDLRKDPAVLEAAYNDSRGVTSEFNLNMLRVLNARTGADFDPGAFRHRAFYDPRLHRVEMHLVSLRDQSVAVPGGGVFHFEEGETVRTEISCKYDRASVEEMLAAAELRLAAWQTDPEERYALALAGR